MGIETNIGICLTRRSFLIASGAAVAGLAFPSIAGLPEYVRFMEPPEMWERNFNGRFVKHVTVWRTTMDGEHKTYGLGVQVADEDVAEGRVDGIMQSYNRGLENTRRKHGFPEGMIKLAARDPATVRWVYAGSWLPMMQTSMI